MPSSFKIISIVILGLAAAPGSAHATLIGSWNFAGGTPLVDSTGNFGTLQLNGSATVANGALNVSGSGTSTTGWAETTGYSGPSISSKTMVAWGTLTGLQSSAFAGAMMSISALDRDQFDAIDYGEQIANTWINGSSYFSRTQTFSPGYTETAANLNQLFEIAITYNFLGNGSEQITGYINGISIGSYTTGNAATWTAGDTVVGFGPRAIQPGNVPYGGIDATVDAAQLYNTALTQVQIQALQQPGTAVPEPTTLSLMGAGLFGLWRVRRRKRIA